jgi:flagella basal body P-ring formation protein FlgA
MRFYSTPILFVIFGLLSCSLEGHAQSAAEQKIGGLATQQVLSFCSSSCEVEVKSKWMPDKIAGLDSAQIKQLQFNEVGLPKGYQTVNVFFADDGETKSAQMQLFVELKQKLPVVNKRIERNQTITQNDLTWRILDITRMKKFPIAKVEEITGKAAGRLISKGNVILNSDLQQAPIIEVGDNIQMVYREGGIEVALDCTARQARAKGEQIRVFSRETRKTYIGKVLTPSKVIWEKTL